jgi:hypothetical protein
MKAKSKKKSSDDSRSSNSVEILKVGDFVRHTFEDDGVEYEAEILSINESGNALIRYIGYGNEERVKLEDLVASWGFEEREKQKLLAEADNPTNEPKMPSSSSSKENSDSEGEETERKTRTTRGVVRNPPPAKKARKASYTCG